VPSGDTGIRPVDNGPPPVDSGPPPPVDAGPTRCDSPPPEVLASQPAFSPAVIARIRALRAVGVARGNRLDVLAKIGDSITEAGGFLTDLGMGWYELGPYACLEPTVAFFRRTAVPNAVNSLARSSVCAMGGWLSDNALLGDPMSPLRAELNAIRPGYAVIMYGTNDLDRSTGDALAANLTRIATICEDFGTVPVLSTIPDRLDQAAPASRVAGYNERIRGVAAARNLPLIDYWAAMRPLPRNGIEEDGIHPSVYRRDGSAEAGYFTDEGCALRLQHAQPHHDDDDAPAPRPVAGLSAPMPPRRLDPAQLPPERALARRLAARGPQRPITVVHDGDSVPALEGESLALSLLVAGRETLSRSAKYHRPRGAMCLCGHCEGCLLRVDGNPNAMACRTPTRPGMVATSQNAFPHARLDVFRVTDWFFPKHLDHHGLMVGLGETVNRTMQSVARKMAGLGTLPDAAAPVQPAHVHQTDVLVVGGGSAGVAAANALVAEGFSVMLCDRERSLGGARRDDPSDPLDDLEALHPDVMCLVDATAVATYDNGTLVVQGDALHQVRARVRVLACGTVDTVGTFVHNDLPGVYTARAFARALCAGVLLADRVALVGPNTHHTGPRERAWRPRAAQPPRGPRRDRRSRPRVAFRRGRDAPRTRAHPARCAPSTRWSSAPSPWLPTSSRARPARGLSGTRDVSASRPAATKTAPPRAPGCTSRAACASASCPLPSDAKTGDAWLAPRLITCERPRHHERKDPRLPLRRRHP
jgi:hypothetical protein